MGHGVVFLPIKIETETLSHELSFLTFNAGTFFGTVSELHGRLAVAM